MKKGLLLACGLLALNFSASATTLYISLSLDWAKAYNSAVGNETTLNISNPSSCSPAGTCLGVDLAPNTKTSIGVNLTTGATGGGLNFDRVRAFYVISAAYTDLNDPFGSDVTAAYLAGAYNVNSVEGLNVGVLYRDDNGGDTAQDAFQVNLRDNNANMLQANVLNVDSGSTASFSGTTDSLSNVSLNGVNVSGTLETYLVNLANSNPGDLNLMAAVQATAGDFRLRGISGDLVLTTEATPNSPVPEPSGMGLLGGAIFGLGLIFRGRAQKQ